MSVALRILLLALVLQGAGAARDAGLPSREPWALRIAGEGARLEAPHVPLDDLEALTVEAWVKDWKGAILCQGKAGDPENSLWLSTGNRAGVGVPHECCGFESGAGVNYEIAPGYGPPGRWTHLALVYAEGKVSLYVQGKLVRALPAPKPGPFDASRPLYLGAHHYETVNSGTGLLGPVRISNVARYAKEFAPVSRWTRDDRTLFLLPLTEGSGKQARDASGHGRHAALLDAAWVRAPELRRP